jgi:hypothetical protein
MNKCTEKDQATFDKWAEGIYWESPKEDALATKEKTKKEKNAKKVKK